MSEEIIIDGVNVAGCEHLTEIKGCWLSTCDYLPYKGNITNQLCKYNDNCYYKQFKRLQEENERLKKKQITKNGFICDCEQNAKYKQALEEIRKIAEKLITETPEYNSCYYKDECSDNCTPKKQSRVQYCCYENVDKILTTINEVLNEKP